MIFRDYKTGKLIIIKRQDYHCNKDYYTAICNTMNIEFPKLYQNIPMYISAAIGGIS